MPELPVLQFRPPDQDIPRTERAAVEAPRRRASSDAELDVVVVNPLGGALHHYTTQVLKSLRDAGLRASSVSAVEPSAGGGSRLNWIRAYCAALLSARRYRTQVLVTWPVLGHLDRILIPLLSGDRRAAVVMHDPHPLVRAIGYGKVAVGVADRLAPAGTLLVHSALAKEELLAQGVVAVMIPHPIVPSNVARRVPSTPVVRVLGQWKADRDIALLTVLPDLLPKVQLEIVGRGWPSVDGWLVRDEFVPEDELNMLVSTSSAVLIPYQRFYQSGIAARALELAVPVVGRRRELEPMTGADYPYLVSSSSASDWAETLRAALSSHSVLLESVRKTVAQNSLDAWKAWGER